MKILVSTSISIDKVEKTSSGKLKYSGHTFEGFNKPKKADHKKYKKVVLAKKGKECKLVWYGHKDYQDFTQHKDPERRKSFLKRMKGVLKKDGTPAYKDIFSAAYWAVKDLW